MASTPPALDIPMEIERLRAELVELRQQQIMGQIMNALLEQLVQKLDTGKGMKIWVDKPEKFDGKIGDTVENWLKGWELWFKHREKQDGDVEERTKIETAMQCTVEKVKLASARHERENGEWKDWDSFKKDMKAKYTSTDSGFARYLKLKQIVQKDGETVESYYQRFDENINRQKEDEAITDDDGDGNNHKRINNQYNYMFVDNLHRSIKSGFLHLPEARDFQKKDLYELRELANPVEESVSHFQATYLGTAKSTFTSNSNSNKSSKKFRKS